VETSSQNKSKGAGYTTYPLVKTANYPIGFISSPA
jgi:hypothetical protein